VSRNQWARDRVQALKDIYALSLKAYPWLESYDFRQMVGQPAWFGSYGHDGWAGAGEAQPRTIAHELSHSYWGEFPVEGRPDLSWAPGPDGVAPALKQYRAEMETFLRQPPDRFEPLRDRFRNMPNLTVGEYPDLHHSGEADILSFTGGNINLVPPILRKYWSSFLTPYGTMGYVYDGGAGPDPVVRDWAEAIAWYRGLNEADRSAVEQVFGLQHFPLGNYKVSPMTGAKLSPGVAEAIKNEERQRLLDFAGQFELIKSREFALVDAAGVNRGFTFWRSYLSEMRELHRRHPAVLRDHTMARARALGAALDFHISIERLSPQSQTERFRAAASDASVRELAVLLKERAIIELFGKDAPPEKGVEGVIGHYAAKLSVTAARVDAVLTEARKGAPQGARALEGYLGSLEEAELRSDAGLIFDLLRETDGDLTRRILPAVSDAVLLRLLRIAPATARAHEIGPERLLRAAGVVRGAAAGALTEGARTLTGNSSGNFAIDLPYELAVFDVIEAMGRAEPAGALRVISESALRIDPWTERGSTEMLSIFDRARPDAAKLIAGSKGPRTSPQRIIHSLAGLDPDLAAELLSGAVSQAGGDLGPRALLEFAYDAYWRGAGGGNAAEPGLTGRFLARLALIRGGDWLRSNYDQAVALVRTWADDGETEPGSEAEFRRTLSEAAKASGPQTAALIEHLLSSR
jgi:hypothetical protein